VHSQALVGMVALTGQWWLDAREVDRDLDMQSVAAHLVNLAWHGLSALEVEPALRVLDSTAGAGPEGHGSR
jgi:hypothetical protein